MHPVYGYTTSLLTAFTKEENGLVFKFQRFALCSNSWDTVFGKWVNYKIIKNEPHSSSIKSTTMLACRTSHQTGCWYACLSQRGLNQRSTPSFRLITETDHEGRCCAHSAQESRYCVFVLWPTSCSALGKGSKLLSNSAKAGCFRRSENCSQIHFPGMHH